MKTLKLIPIFLFLSLSAFAQVKLGIYPLATASGTDTYTATVSPAPSAYESGQRFNIKFTNANTGAATINLNGLGAKTIVKNGSAALSAGDISAGQILFLQYDGTNMQVVGGGGAGGAEYTASNGITLSGTDFQLGGTWGSLPTDISGNTSSVKFRLSPAPPNYGGLELAAGAYSIFQGPASTSYSTATRGLKVYTGGIEAKGAPIKYATDLSASYTDRSLIDRGFANATFWKLSGTSTIPANTTTTIENTNSKIHISNDGLTPFGDGIIIASFDATQPAALYAGAADLSSNASAIAAGNGTESYFNIQAIPDGAAGVTFSFTQNSFTDLASVFFEDSRAVTKGIEYLGDYSAGFTDRSLIDKGFGNANYFKASGETVLTADTYINTGVSNSIHIGETTNFTTGVSINATTILIQSTPDAGATYRGIEVSPDFIKLNNLPTTSPCATYGTGTLWNDAGTLKICP